MESTQLRPTATPVAAPGGAGRWVAEAVVIALLLLFMWPAWYWHGNEENYFQLGFARVAPALFRHSHSVFDASNARFLSEYIIGSTVSLFGYDGAHFVLRALMALLYGASLTLLFRRLGVRLWERILIICAFEFFRQQLLGNEWLFNGVEAKTMAYAAMFTAFTLMLDGRWAISAGLQTLSIYLHFLVGGFWLAAISVLHGVRKTTRPAAMKFFLLSALGALPLFILILKERLAHPEMTSADGLTASYIYCVISAPMHCAPFADSEFRATWISGAALTVGVCIAAFTLAFSARKDLTRTLLMLGGCICVYLLAALGISYHDRAVGALGRLYFYRPSSFTLLLLLTGVVLYAKERWPDFAVTKLQPTDFIVVAIAVIAYDARPTWKVMLVVLAAAGCACAALRLRSPADRIGVASALCVALVGCVVSSTFAVQVKQIIAQRAVRSEIAPIVAALERTPPGSVVVVSPNDEMYGLTIVPRLLPRPTLVNFKFVPTLPDEIIRWYELDKWRSRLLSSGCRDGRPIRADYILATNEQWKKLVAPCGLEQVQSGRFTLFRVVADATSQPGA